MGNQQRTQTGEEATQKDIKKLFFNEILLILTFKSKSRPYKGFKGHNHVPSKNHNFSHNILLCQ